MKMKRELVNKRALPYLKADKKGNAKWDMWQVLKNFAKFLQVMLDIIGIINQGRK